MDAIEEDLSIPKEPKPKKVKPPGTSAWLLCLKYILCDFNLQKRFCICAKHYALGKCTSLSV